MSERGAHLAAGLLEAENVQLRAENKQLRAVLKECADDLEGWVKAHYKGTLDYPSQQRRQDRDLQSIIEARKLLAE